MKRRETSGSVWMVMLAGLAMSLGWGIRGDYGHEAGAMLPGALVGLACCLGSGRGDWLERGSVVAMLGALGWAFGGQMSYGVVIGYTADSRLVNVVYGYGALFVMGALWGGIGGIFLALGLTWSRERLEGMVVPLAVLFVVWMGIDLAGVTERLSDRWEMHDTDWVAAGTALLVAAGLRVAGERWREGARVMAVVAGGWWGGYLGLTVLLGLRMTPPRSDNWSGCVGIAVALAVMLARERNRAALMLAGYGALAGGIGFAVGDFVQMLGRAGWGPIGRYEALQELDYWKWMERIFGLVMGIGVALGVRRLAAGSLARVEGLAGSRRLRYFSLLVLLVVMPWKNFVTNVRFWMEKGQFAEPLLGIGPVWWISIVAAGVTAVMVLAIDQHVRGRLRLAPAEAAGRVQLLLLALVWLFIVGDFARTVSHLEKKGVLSVHVSFWLTGILLTALALLAGERVAESGPGGAGPDDARWRAGRRMIGGWLLAPALVLVLGWLTLKTHSDPLPGSRQRWGAAEQSGPGTTGR